MAKDGWPVYYIAIPAAQTGWAEDKFEAQYIAPQAPMVRNGKVICSIAMEYELDCLEQNRRVAQAEDLPIKEMESYPTRFYASEYGLSAEVYVAPIGMAEDASPGYL